MRTYELIQHKGKTIIYLDFSNLKAVDEISALMGNAKQYIHSKPEHSVCILTNIEGMHFSPSIKDIFTEFAKSNKPFIKASAIVGVTGLRLIVFNGVARLSGRDIKIFNQISDAKDWLANKN